MRKAQLGSGISIESDKAKQERRIRKHRGNPEFASYLKQIRQRIAGGSSLQDIKAALGVSETLWRDLFYCIASAYMNPESMALEWMMRQSSRYQMAAEVYNMNKEAKDSDGMLKSLLAMAKIDENDIEIKKALGLIKPVTFDQGSGYSSADIDRAEQNINRLVDEELLNALRTERTIEMPQPIHVLARLESQRQPDPMEQAPLVANDSEG